METNDMTSKEIKNTAPVPSPKPPRKRLKKIVTGCLIAAAAVVLYGFSARTSSCPIPAAISMFAVT